MRRTVLVGTVVMVATITALASLVPSSLAANALIATANEPAAKGLLLTVGELPIGWSVDSAPPLKLVGCGAALRQNPGSPTSTAGVQFQEGQYPVLGEQVTIYSSPARAFAAQARMATTLKSCTSFATEGVTVRLGPLSFPTIGSRSSAYQATAALGGTTLIEYIVLAVRGSETIVANYGDLGTPDIKQAERLTKLATSKLPTPRVSPVLSRSA